MKKKAKSYANQFWKLYWKDDTILSYIFFFIVTYLVLKFVLFPSFLFVTGLSDVTAVMSGSMKHDERINETYYEWMIDKGYTLEEMEDFPFSKGLNIGDIVFVKDTRSPEEITVGDVIVFYNPRGYSIIHRVVFEGNDTFTTKGDANLKSDYYEFDIPFEYVKGKAIFKIPLLGYPRVLLGRLGV